jgi:hypothetical protein
MKIAMHKYIKHNEHVKKMSTNFRFQYPKPSTKYTKILLPLNEKHLYFKFSMK